MTNNTKKKIIIILSGLILSIIMSVAFPSNVGKARNIEGIAFDNEKSIVDQSITSVTLKPYQITKIYYQQKLVGILQDTNLINKTIENIKKDLNEENHGDYNVILNSDVYTITENTFWVYQQRDEQIIAYMKDNGLFAVETVKIEFLRNNEVTDTIYVASISQFTDALHDFVLNFVDEDVYYKVENGEVFPDLTDYGTQETNVYIEEVIRSTPSSAKADEILETRQDIFNYLCYGREYELTYYTVEEYDTVSGVATKNGLSARQVMSLNPEIRDIDQALVVGEKLNVTYFNSPISVITEMQNYTREITYPPSPIYNVDPELKIGEMEVVSEGKNGYNDVLYTEIYVNGVLSGYRQEKSTIVEVPVQAVYRVGSAGGKYSGSISFGLPCANAAITCGYYGYAGHTGVDFINPYNRYGDVIAVTDGVVTVRTWSAAAGNYYRIDTGEDENGNHFVIRYGHMKVPGFFDPGTQVYQGMVIGQIGSTGRSTGPHVHISVYVNGTQVNPCDYLPCELCRRM